MPGTYGHVRCIRFITSVTTVMTIAIDTFTGMGVLTANRWR
jgi:hypothetical protein